jgi:hypothetical protein
MPIQRCLVDMDNCVNDLAAALIGSVSWWSYLIANFKKEKKKMKNLKNEGFKTMETKSPSSKGWRMLVALVLIVTSLFVAAPTQLALADSGGVHGHTFDFTFTKWVTTPPASYPSFAGVSMAGVVGGDVGNGVYAGKVLSDNLTVPGFWLAHARYEFYGKKHSFIADVNVVENDTTIPHTAVITGVITQGWLKGAQITGGYTVLSECNIATPGNVFGTLCFQGTLHVHMGGGSEH